MNFRIIKSPALLSALSLSLTSSLHAAEVRVAVAANFAQPMKEIAAEFEKETTHKVSLTQVATGKFYAQISNARHLTFFSLPMTKRRQS